MSRERLRLLPLLLPFVVLLIAFGCGRKGMLVPRDKLPDDQAGTPLELRLYPPRQNPADALGMGDAFQSPSQPGVIIEHNLTPTPVPAGAPPAPTPPPADQATPQPTPTENHE